MSAAQWDDRYRGTDLVWSATPNTWVEQETSGLPPGRALDLACGEGRNSIWLAQRGWRVTGADFSREAIRKAERIAGRLQPPVSVDWRCADATRFTDPQGFDLVLVVYLQLPADDRRLAMRAAWAAVSPGGRLLVIGHHSDNLTAGVGGPPDPGVLYTAADVLGDLAFSEPGVIVERAERVPRFVEGKPRPALDTLVRLRKG